MASGWEPMSAGDPGAGRHDALGATAGPWSPTVQRLLGYLVVVIGLAALAVVGADIEERPAAREIAIGAGGIVLVALGVTMTVAHTLVLGSALVAGGIAALVFAAASTAVVIEDVSQVFLLVPAAFALRAAPTELRLGARTLATIVRRATDGPGPRRP